jgi:transcriptional antiterminator RfaH
MSGMRWYVAHTQAANEARARWHLENQGFVAYLPRYLKRRRHARRIDWVPAPLFPRYLFVGMDLAVARWRAIRSTIGIAGLVCQCDRPTPVPSGIVEAIKARENDRGVVVLPAAPLFDKGDRVNICEGALRGLSGLVEGIADEARIVILLDLLGRQLRVHVPLETVQAVA